MNCQVYSKHDYDYDDDVYDLDLSLTETLYIFILTYNPNTYTHVEFNNTFSPYVRSHFVPSATWLLSTLQPFLKHCIMENVKGRNNNCDHSCFECCCGTLSRTFILSLKNSSHFLPLFSIPSLKQTKSLYSMIMILLYMYTSCFAATFIISTLTTTRCFPYRWPSFWSQFWREKGLCLEWTLGYWF